MCRWHRFHAEQGLVEDNRCLSILVHILQIALLLMSKFLPISHRIEQKHPGIRARIRNDRRQIA